MIYAGYPCIGKTVLSKSDNKYVDLESSIFKGNKVSDYVEKKTDDWYVMYCNIADHFSNMGYMVFVSTHADVRRCMNENGIEFTVIYPDKSLKDKWLEKLLTRYEISGSDKDKRAMDYVKEHYDETIDELSKEANRIVIKDMNYDLQGLIDDFMNNKDSNAE